MFTQRIRGVEAALVMKKTPDDFPLITVECIRMPPRATFRWMIKKIGEELPKRFDKLEFLQDEEVEREVYRAVYRAESGGKKLMVVQGFSREGNWFWILTAMDNERNFASHDKDIRAVFGSIR